MYWCCITPFLYYRKWLWSFYSFKSKFLSFIYKGSIARYSWNFTIVQPCNRIYTTLAWFL